jgi:hypothetical protein
MFHEYFPPKKFAAQLTDDVRAVSISRACTIILVAMLGVDFAFIAWSGAQGFQGLPKDNWHIAVDRSIPEFWQYAKWAALALLLSILFMDRRSLVYMAFAILFLYFLIDDSMMVHENFGATLARYFGFRPAFRLRAEDFGELLVTGIASIFLFGFLIISHLRESSKDVRRFARVMFLLVVALAAFGVGTDMLDIMVPWPIVRMILELIEDGGEMVVATLMVIFVLSHLTHKSV